MRKYSSSSSTSSAPYASCCSLRRSSLSATPWMPLPCTFSSIPCAYSSSILRASMLRSRSALAAQDSSKPSVTGASALPSTHLAAPMAVSILGRREPPCLEGVEVTQGVAG
uniref:Uncharacterized protein n=1 Tax=Triticum urartu TaxID=4572 RepID=A0A8R7QN29_TRIUA